MRERLEEDLDFDDEDEDDDDLDDQPVATVPTQRTVVPPPEGGRDYEYRTELLTAEQVTDGTTLASHLTRASADGWDLVDIVNAGERHAILLRRLKRTERNARQVGFTPPKL